jgi:uncharacterized membrane protein YidH (DUF202 family)
MTAGYTQLFLGLILIGLIAAFFQFYTGRMRWYAAAMTTETEIFLVFAIFFAVLQAMSGWAMVQQSGHGAPGQLPETIHGLLKVVVAAGLIAFGFAIRNIFLHNHASATDSSAHLSAIEAFVIISFIVTCYLTYSSDQGMLNWQNMNTSIGKRVSGFIFGILQLIFSIILFSLLAALLQGLTANDSNSTTSINSAGKYMVWFGLLFSVLEFFAGCTMMESSTKKMTGVNPSSVSIVNKVTLAAAWLAFGFACRHINIWEQYYGPYEGPRVSLVHAIEAFIIINFFLTLAIDILCVKGRIEW